MTNPPQKFNSELSKSISGLLRITTESQLFEAFNLIEEKVKVQIPETAIITKGNFLLKEEY